MPIIIRKGFRFTDLLAASARSCRAAVFCLAVPLCAAPPAGAEPEIPQTEDTHAEKAQAPEAAVANVRSESRPRIPKKRIAIAQFDVANTQHVDDINNIYDGLPSALSSRLEASGEFLSAYTGRSIPAEAGVAQREAIVEIAGETGAQFLISGTVVNAGTSQEKRSVDTPLGSVKVPFSGYKKRHIEVEFSVYDGLTGNRLLLRRLDEQATGEVMVGNYKPFGSSLFFETEFGKATNRLLDSAVKDIRAALENMLFSAHIVRVGEKKVFLDAGSDSLLKPGDVLVAYVRDPGTSIAGLEGPVPGITARAVDTVTLTQVQPQYSIGELSEDAAKLGIRVGNIARIDPDEQRNLVAKQIAAQQIAKAQQEAKEEAERLKVQKAAEAEAARVKAKQDALAEAERIKAEKKAKAQAAAEAKAAKLKAARANRSSAAREAQARAEAQAARLKARQEAKANAARIKAEQKAKADEQAAGEAAAESGVAEAKTEAKAEAKTAPKPARKKATQKGQSKTEARAAGEAGAQQVAESGVAKTKTEGEAAPKPARKKAVNQDRTEVRAVAEEDLQRAAAEAEAGKAGSGVAETKPAAPLKLKQVKP